MSLLKENFDELKYEDVLEIIEKLSDEQELEEKFAVVGGVVPYLVADMKSDRAHSNLDLLVKYQDMDIIRNFLKKKHLYNPKYDSMNYLENKQDYGLLTKIKGLPVNFFPYKKNSKDGVPVIDTRMFSLSDVEGQINLDYDHLEGIYEEDFFSEKELNNGKTIKTISPEAFVIMKLDVGKNYFKDKDHMDAICILLNSRLEFGKLKRIYSAFNNKGTKRSVIAKDAEKLTLDKIRKCFSFVEDLGVEMQ